MRFNINGKKKAKAKAKEKANDKGKVKARVNDKEINQNNVSQSRKKSTS